MQGNLNNFYNTINQHFGHLKIILSFDLAINFQTQGME